MCEKFIGKFKAVIHKYKLFQDNTEEEIIGKYEISHSRLFINLTFLEYLLCARPSSR